MRVLSVTAALALGAPSALAAQASGPAGVADRAVEAEPTTGWQIERSDFADLWFGAMSTLGFHGTGPVPLYAKEHAADLHAAKERAGVYPTRLDREGERLRAALEEDPSFELFHFVPVYLGGATVPQALDALRAVASGSPTRLGVLDPSVFLGARAIASVLNTPAQRRLIADLVELLDEEWRALEEARIQDPAVPQTSLQEVWDRDYAPALNGFLERWGLGGGTVIVTPTVDLEGRFYHGSPTDPSDNVVVVGSGGDEAETGAALSGLVRELCFAVVRDAFDEVKDRFQDRSLAARESDHAATRCGALVLERYLPAALSNYRARFGPTLQYGAPPEVDPDVRRALDEAMARAVGRS